MYIYIPSLLLLLLLLLCLQSQTDTHTHTHTQREERERGWCANALYISLAPCCDNVAFSNFLIFKKGEKSHILLQKKKRALYPHIIYISRRYKRWESRERWSRCRRRKRSLSPSLEEKGIIIIERRSGKWRIKKMEALWREDDATTTTTENAMMKNKLRRWRSEESGTKNTDYATRIRRKHRRRSILSRLPRITTTRGLKRPRWIKCWYYKGEWRVWRCVCN